MKSINPVLPKVRRDKRKKLTDKKIEKIKSMFATGNYTLKDLGRKFKVRAQTIRYHVDEKYRLARIAFVTAQIKEKLKDPDARKKQNQQNSDYYFRLMKIPGNKNKWRRYHRENQRKRKELA